MKDDFYFWIFVSWISSIFLWSFLLTTRKKRVRKWIGGLVIIFNFISGLCIMPVIFKLSATYSKMDGIKTFDDLIINTMYLLFVFAPMFFMGYLLRKSGKNLDNFSNNLQNNEENEKGA